MQRPIDRAAAFRALASGAVVCPVDDVGILTIDGADAAKFLKGQLSGDVDTIAPGQSQRSSYNTPKGRMLANLRVWRRPADAAGTGFGALLAADLVAAIQKRLSMFVMRDKVRLTNETGRHRLFGVAGAGAAAAVTAAFGSTPPPGAAVEPGPGLTVLGLPDARFVVVAAPEAAAAASSALSNTATNGDNAHWRWLGIRAGVPLITAATSDLFVAQMINWDVLEGIRTGKGCYPGQEIVARMRSLGGLKERLFAFQGAGPPPQAGTRLYSPVFGDQPCGTVVNAAPAPEGDFDMLAVAQMTAAGTRSLALGSADGPPLAPLALPYALPTAVAPRARIV